MKVAAIQCPTCRDVIFSRAHHDCHWCSCGPKGVMIDGGWEYVRVGYGAEKPLNINLETEITKEKFYQDYNKRINKFGVHKCDEILKENLVYKLKKNGKIILPKE